MFHFLEQYDIYLKTFWYIAIPISLLFLIQAIITFTGLGGESDLEHEVHLDGGGLFEYFTVRNAINFLLGFAWGGICFYPLISNKILLVATALLTGLVFLMAFFYIIQQIKKLEENNSFNPMQTIGREGEVYLRIPINGKGKVQVSLNGAVHELEAISDSIFIETGTKVIIMDVLEHNTLLVKPI
jgi:hypothetical protein